MRNTSIQHLHSIEQKAIEENRHIDRKKPAEKRYFKRFFPRRCRPFWTVFGPLLAFFGTIFLSVCVTLGCFWHRLGIVLGLLWPFSPPFLRAKKCVETLKPYFDPILKHYLRPFWDHFGNKIGPFWGGFGVFLTHFWIDPGSFRNHSGLVLVRFWPFWPFGNLFPPEKDCSRVGLPFSIHSLFKFLVSFRLFF